MSKTERGENIFLRLHPLQRVLISLLFTTIIFFTIKHKELTPLVTTIILWDVFAGTFLITCWVALIKRQPAQIRKIAKKDDGSVAFVFTTILVSSFASMVAVFLLIVSKQMSAHDEALNLAVTITSILLSWIMVHTTFTFHYAHLFYDVHKTDSSRHAAGLEFPEEDTPDYVDFAYFSFVVGMTFQVSDVQITSRTLRRVVLLHGLLSFALNTFVVAFTINIIAGLKQ